LTVAKDDETETPDRPTIDREAIEAKFRELQGEVEVIGEEARSYGITAAVAVVVVVVAVAFVLGRRRGRRNRTIVEVRRI
jgi:hypothetical protein